MKLYKQARKYGARLFVTATGVMVAAGAHAAAIDVTDVTTDIAAQNAPIAAIGGAVLVLTVGLKAWKWVRKAF